MIEETKDQGKTEGEGDGKPAQSAADTVSKSALDAEVAMRTAAEKQLSEVAEELLAGVPDHLKALIPEELSPSQKVAWFRKARETGLFSKQVASVPETDGGKKPATTPKDTDDSGLPRVKRMAAAYGKTA